MNVLQRNAPLVGRILLALIFVVSGFSKLAGPSQTAGYIASKELPLPMVGAIGAGVLEVICGLMIVVGFRAQWAGLALALFLIPVTAIFHNPSGLSGMEQQMQMAMAMKNLAITGGLLGIAAHGAGPISMDARRVN